MPPDDAGADNVERQRIEAEFLERLQQEMSRLTVEDQLVHLLQTLASLAFQHLGLTDYTAADRDLGQTRLAIDAFSALLDVLAPLRPADEVGIYRSTLAQMQMAYVAQLDRAHGDESRPAAAGATPVGDDEVVEEAVYDAADADPATDTADAVEATDDAKAQSADDVTEAQAETTAAEDERARASDAGDGEE